MAKRAKVPSRADTISENGQQLRKKKSVKKVQGQGDSVNQPSLPTPMRASSSAAKKLEAKTKKSKNQSAKDRAPSAQAPSAQDRLAEQMNAMPINPAQDCYGITDPRLQAICFVSLRAQAESVRNEKYSQAANTIGAWFITAGEQLAALGPDRVLSRMFEADLVQTIPDLYRLFRMACDAMRPWAPQSPEAQAFLRAIMCNPKTHPLAAAAAISDVPVSLAEPWLTVLYDRLIAQHPDSQLTALFSDVAAHTQSIHLGNGQLMAARKLTFDHLARRFRRFLPDMENKPKTGRVAFLVDSFNPELADQVLPVLRHLRSECEMAIYELDEGRPLRDQRGFIGVTPAQMMQGLGPATLPPGVLTELRTLSPIFRRFDPAQTTDVRAREIFRSLCNFHPNLVIALDAPGSILKGALRVRYPVMDWIVSASPGMAFGGHVLATSNPQEAELEIRQSSFARLDTVSILPLAKSPDEIAAHLLEAIKASS